MTNESGRMKRNLRRALIAAASVLAVLGAVLGWLFNSESAARMVVARALQSLDGRLQLGAVAGTLSGPLQLRNLHYRDQGIDASVGQLQVDLAPWSLLARRVHLQSLRVADLKLSLTTGRPPATNRSTAGETPISLEAPIDIVLDQLLIERGQIVQDEVLLLQFDTLDLTARWTRSALQLGHLDLRGRDGQVHLNGAVLAGPGNAGQGEGRFDWRVGKTLWSGTLKASSDVRRGVLDLALVQPMSATLQASVQQATARAWTLTLTIPAFDPKKLAADSTHQSIALDLQGSGDKRGGVLTAALELDGHRATLDPMQFSLKDNLLTIEQLLVSSPDVVGKLQMQGTLDLARDNPLAALSLNWEAVELPADLVGQILQTHGAAEIAGDRSHARISGKFALGPPQQLSDFAVDLSSIGSELALERLSIKQPDGQLTLSGTVALGDPLRWDLRAKAEHFDSGALLAAWPGFLDFSLLSQGEQGKRGPIGTLAIERFDGVLRQHAIRASGNLEFAPDFLLAGELQLDSGASRLRVSGKGGDASDVHLVLGVTALSDFLPDARGTAQADLRLRGRWPALSINGSVRAQGLALAAISVDQLNLGIAISDLKAATGRVSANAGGLRSGDLHFERVDVLAEGNAGAHRLSLDASGAPLSVKMAVQGSNSGDNWNEALDQLDLDVGKDTKWTLERVVALTHGSAGSTLGELCLGAQGPRLCVSASMAKDGTGQALYRFEHLPLQMISSIAAPDSVFRLQGEIDGDGRIAVNADGQPRGGLKMAAAQGRIFYPDEAEAPLLAFSDLILELALDPGAQHATLSAALNDGGHLAADFGVSGEQRTLSGTVDLALNNLALVELLSADVAAVQGRLEAHAGLSGTAQRPVVESTLQVHDFAAEIPSAGLKLRDGQFALSTAMDRRYTLSGELSSGDGKIELHSAGSLDDTQGMQIDVSGSNFLAADVPGARLIVTPKLHLVRESGQLNLSGDVAIPKAMIDVGRLPNGAGAQVSPDVAISDRPAPPVESGTPISAEINIVFGDQVKLKGFGLDGAIAGRLLVLERPGRQTVGRGEINVAGTYQAYGQNLRIERGRLLFAGTAIDNPGLDIRAVRKLTEVTAGLRVQGTAQVPVLTVYSEPALEQSDAMSYLITGKPLSALKGSEGDMVGTAARALGTATGDLLAKSVGARLGVDAGVNEESALGGSAFTVGKYLSPRLYLSYGVGLFAPGEVITLRYRLSKRWRVEAQSATTSTRAGIDYRYEH